MKTTLHTYSLDISRKADDAAYTTLLAKLKGRKKSVMLGFQVKDGWHEKLEAKKGEITLETEFIFDNQWNTEDGLRLHDWMEYSYENEFIRQGYYLEITDEMKAIRDNTHKCGYCGKQYASPCICEACLASENLRAANLHLLKTKPVSQKKREPLTEEEKQVLVAKFVQK